MTSNESIVLCKNCRQNIDANKMFLHEGFCKRNNVFCQHCEKVFLKEDYSDHLKEISKKESSKKESSPTKKKATEQKTSIDVKDIKHHTKLKINKAIIKYEQLPWEEQYKINNPIIIETNGEIISKKNKNEFLLPFLGIDYIQNSRNFENDASLQNQEKSINETNNLYDYGDIHYNNYKNNQRVMKKVCSTNNMSINKIYTNNKFNIQNNILIDQNNNYKLMNMSIKEDKINNINNDLMNFLMDKDKMNYNNNNMINSQPSIVKVIKIKNGNSIRKNYKINNVNENYQKNQNSININKKLYPNNKFKKIKRVFNTNESISDRYFYLDNKNSIYNINNTSYTLDENIKSNNNDIDNNNYNDNYENNYYEIKNNNDNDNNFQNNNNNHEECSKNNNNSSKKNKSKYKTNTLFNPIRKTKLNEIKKFKKTIKKITTDNINNYNDSESNIKEPSDNVLKKNVKHKNLVIKEKSVDDIIEPVIDNNKIIIQETKYYNEIKLCKYCNCYTFDLNIHYKSCLNRIEKLKERRNLNKSNIPAEIKKDIPEQNQKLDIDNRVNTEGIKQNEDIQQTNKILNEEKRIIKRKILRPCVIGYKTEDNKESNSPKYNINGLKNSDYKNYKHKKIYVLSKKNNKIKINRNFKNSTPVKSVKLEHFKNMKFNNSLNNVYDPISFYTQKTSKKIIVPKNNNTEITGYSIKSYRASEHLKL